MSHRAVNWALEQRHLKPGPWVVLIQLSDRHNKDTRAVFPDQHTIAADCNMSRATVNRHVADLEAMDLVQRVQRVHPTTKKQLPTYYILGLDFDNPPVIEHAVSQIRTRKNEGENENKIAPRVSKSDTEAVSQKTQKPCLKNGQSRVSNCDTNQVNKPRIEPCADQAAPTDDVCGEEGQNLEQEAQAVFDRISEFYPKMSPQASTVLRIRHVLLSYGAAVDELVSAAKAYAREQEGNDLKYVRRADRFFLEDFWKSYATEPAKTDQNAILTQRANAIISKANWVMSLKPSEAGECIMAGLVTPEQCRSAGISL